jgi:hypothetical protein
MLALIFGVAGVRTGGSIALGLGAALAAAGALFSSLRISRA